MSLAKIIVGVYEIYHSIQSVMKKTLILPKLHNPKCHLQKQLIKEPKIISNEIIFCWENKTSKFLNFSLDI